MQLLHLASARAQGLQLVTITCRFDWSSDAKTIRDMAVAAAVADLFCRHISDVAVGFPWLCRPRPPRHSLDLRRLGRRVEPKWCFQSRGPGPRARGANGTSRSSFEFAFGSSFRGGPCRARPWIYRRGNI